MKVCLNAIVKNEVKNLPRLLESVAPHLACYAIGDTGSTDGTPDLIRRYFDERGIPGVVAQYEFEDYSQARNRALHLATGLPHDFDCVLLADADMELVVEDDAFFQRPVAPRAAHMILQVGSQHAYDNIRLIGRGTADRARYKKRTHEYLAVPGHVPKLPGIRFIDHESGANRGPGNRDKHERDLKLLMLDWAEEPDGRTAFYLAETYWWSDRPQEAIAWYERAAELQHSDEEKWYARYKHARCLLADVAEAPAALDRSAPNGANRHQRRAGAVAARRTKTTAAGTARLRPRTDQECAAGVAALLEVHHERPSRAEPLLHLSRHYRLRGRNDLACIFAEAGKRVAYPKDDSLFIEREAYEHGFDGEIGICGWYSQMPQRTEAGRVATMHLTHCPSAAEHLRWTARSNSRCYAKPLFGSTDFMGHRTYVQVRVDCPANMAAFNPSIARAPDGSLRAVVRTANYPLRKDASGKQNWDAYTADDPVRTENYLVDLAWPSLEITGQRKLRFESTTQPCSGLVRGYEDCRLFWWQSGWWATATVRDRGDGMICQIVLWEIDGAREAVLQSPSIEVRNEKNWMPFVDATDELHLVYSIDPCVVLQVDKSTLRAREISRTPVEQNLVELRGGSQLVPHRTHPSGAGEERLICIAHETIPDSSEPMHGRCYLHRLVEFKHGANGLQLSRVSWPFTLLQRGVEFCAGLCLTPDGSGYVVSFGARGDEIACLGLLDAGRVEQLLQEGGREPV